MADQQQTDRRNYLEEAVAIATGRSIMLAQREHLVALLAQKQSVVDNLKKCTRVLNALLVDNRVPSMRVAPEALQRAEDGVFAKLEVKTDEGGGIVVTRIVVSAAAPTSPSVN